MQVSSTTSKKTILLLMLIFGAPFLVAWYLYFYSSHLGWRHSNQGELLSKPFQLSELKLKNYQGELVSNQDRKWLVLYQKQDCNTVCQQVLDKLMRLRLVLGKEMPRTQAWLITAKPLPEMMAKQVEHQRGLDTQLRLNGSQSGSLVQLDKPIMIADPNGNVILRYQEDAPAKAIHKDLKKLLKISKIG